MTTISTLNGSSSCFIRINYMLNCPSASLQYLNWNFAVTLLVMGSFVPFPVNWAPSRTGLNLLIFRRFDSSLGWPLTTNNLFMNLPVLLHYYRIYYRLMMSYCINRRNSQFLGLLVLSPPFSCWNGSWLRHQFLPSLMSINCLGLKLMPLNGPLVVCSCRVVMMACSTQLPLMDGNSKVQSSITLLRRKSCLLSNMPCISGNDI